MARPSNALTLALAASLPLFACKSDDVTGKGGVEPPSGPAPDPFTFSLTTPDTPLITGSTSVDVAGTITGDQPVARVNGVEVEIVDGGFSTEAAYEGALWADSPLFPVLAEGVNADGAWARERVMLAVGESASTADTLYSAIGARLTDHALEQLGPAIDNIIGGLDLSELLVSEDPVTTVLGADVYVTDASFGAVEVSLDFTREGLAYDLTARDVTVALLVDAGWFDTDGDVDVQQIDVEGVIEMGISGGELTLTPFDTSVLITGLGIFGFSDPTGIIDGLVNDFLSETLAGLLEEQVIDLADELVGLLDEITELELEGLVLETDFASVSHDDDGITLLADTRVTATTGTLPAERFANPGDMPAILGQTAPSGAPYAVGLYLDDDLLSAIGAGLVAAELLNQEVGGDLGGLSLDTTLLGAAVPGFETLPPGEPVTLSTRPTLVPLGTAGVAAPEAGRLHLGGLEADILVPGVQAEPVMTIALDAVVGVALGDAEELLAVDVAATEVTLLESTLYSSPAEVEDGLSGLLDIAVPLLIGSLLGDALDLSDLPVELLPVDSGPVDDRAALYLDLGDVSGLSL